MIMKSAENAPNFYQVDNEIRSIGEAEGVILMPASLAWKKFDWTKDYFEKKPSNGFFLWIKKSQEERLNTLVEIASKNIFQKMNNLIVVEKGLNIKLSSFCRSIKRVKGKHFAKAKIVIKDNSSLDFVQRNAWGDKDEFKADYEFILDKNAKLKTTITNLGQGSSITTREDVYLLGKKSSADVRIKMIGENGGTFFSQSYMHGEDEVKGHLECSGLIADNSSTITSIPGIICNSSKAELTHEASIGRISEEKLMYLRMRGLTEKKATELIIKSFLNS
ncbi:MAG: SufD family Fe-S cluster assembly protein [Candidatus Pacebacteria bacterium]|nr:SufD family Fe-S cluster assembly protein [Candidatus Paceibacterota bacterium]